jgi:hypothetical protein
MVDVLTSICILYFIDISGFARSRNSRQEAHSIRNQFRNHDLTIIMESSPELAKYVGKNSSHSILRLAT